MKQHAFILYLFLFALILGISYGCRAKKNIQRVEEVTSQVERVERSADSARIEQRETTRQESRRDATDVSYTRTTDYDSTGNIQRISEEWRDRRSVDMVVRDRQGESVSVTGSETDAMKRDSSSVVINEKKQIQSDSRPVQGFEWVWVIVGLVAVIALILFIRQKVK